MSLVLFLFFILVVEDTHVVLMLCFFLVPGLFLLFFFYPLVTMSYNETSPHCTPHGGPPSFLLVVAPIPVAQLVYKAPVDTLYLFMLSLLCIPFLLLPTHPQALSLKLQPELLGCNIIVYIHP